MIRGHSSSHSHIAKPTVSSQKKAKGQVDSPSMNKVLRPDEIYRSPANVLSVKEKESLRHSNPMLHQRACKKVLRPVDRNVQDVVHTSNPKRKRSKSKSFCGDDPDSSRVAKTDRTHRLQPKTKKSELNSEAEFDCSPAATSGIG